MNFQSSNHFSAKQAATDMTSVKIAPSMQQYPVSSNSVPRMSISTLSSSFAMDLSLHSGMILLCFGSMGDYGQWKKWILITATLVCWARQFGFLGFKDPS